MEKDIRRAIIDYLETTRIDRCFVEKCIYNNRHECMLKQTMLSEDGRCMQMKLEKEDKDNK